MIKIWGRANSINVQKVLWTCEALGLPFERIDAGMQFGVNDTPQFLAMNPNGLVPVLQDGALTLWESHAIVRHLARKYGQGRLWPADEVAAAHADQWMDWCASTVWPDMKVVFMNLVRFAPEQRNMAAVAQSTQMLGKSLAILDRHLENRRYVAADHLTMGDIPLAVIAYRWFSLDIARVNLPHLKAWYERVASEPAFQKHCALPLT